MHKNRFNSDRVETGITVSDPKTNTVRPRCTNTLYTDKLHVSINFSCPIPQLIKKPQYNDIIYSFTM